MPFPEIKQWMEEKGVSQYVAEKTASRIDILKNKKRDYNECSQLANDIFTEFIEEFRTNQKTQFAVMMLSMESSTSIPVMTDSICHFKCE